MRPNNLEVTFHRTVRVAEGRAASNLPPSLGRMHLYKVSDYRNNCPTDWADDALFMSLHDTEAMWISFHSYSKPVAVLVGAGGVNALTGQKLGTKLEKDNYLVCPPQPWIDGWKDVDGTVHQFVATPHKKGEGITVAEQLIGADSKTGAIGLAIFDPKDDAKIKTKYYPYQGVMGQPYSTTMDWGPVSGITGYTGPTGYLAQASFTGSLHSGESVVPKSLLRSFAPHVEMGIGKGGKIIQKIYEDPHGIEVWKDKPTVVFAFYLVDAKTAEEITGEKVAAPVVHDNYSGPWFGLQDEKEKDVLGTSIFSGLKSAAFTGDKSNVEAKEEAAGEPLPVASEKGA